MAWPSNTPEIVAEIDVENSPEWIADRDAKITKWLAEKRLLDAAKEAEMQARKSLVDKMFPTAVRGTNRKSIGRGYNLKFVRALNYTLFKEKVYDDAGEEISRARLVEALEDRIYALGEYAKAKCNSLIKWTPSLVDSEYRKLDLEHETEIEIKKLIDAVLTVEDASPQLTLEEPKK